MKLNPLLGLMSLAALACEQGRQSAPSLPTQTRDSAGIRIVENERPPDDSRLGWTIGPEPAVSIGLLEGEEPYMLHWATDATRLRDGRLVVANSGSNELRVYRADGSLDRIVRRDHVLRSPTEADREPFVEERLLLLEGADIPAFMMQAARNEFETVPMADFFPTFASVLGDAAGHLWVEEYEFPREDRPGTLWTVFDPDGHAIGFVGTPEGLEIYEIGEDYILGRVKDEQEVESIQIWPLDRSG